MMNWGIHVLGVEEPIEVDLLANIFAIKESFVKDRVFINPFIFSFLVNIHLRNHTSNMSPTFP